MGHLVRCKRLATEFIRRGHKCYFFIDKNNYNQIINFTSFYLYKKNFRFDEHRDARIFCNLTRKIGEGFVIVDDYRIGLKWEKFVSKFHKKIISFDDLAKKKHFSDHIINYNPNNFPDIKYDLKLNKKRNSNFLIHPKYNIISREKISRNFKFQRKIFCITFYIGGGGNLLILQKILLKLVKNKKKLKNIKFLVILGKIAKNKKMIVKLSKKYESITYFDKGKDLYYVIKKSDLFFGTSGTAIFETAYLKTPSILFKLTKNQETDVFSLEKLGHYIYFNYDYKSLKITEKISNLIISLIKNYSRFKLLNKKPIIQIDNKGASRIVTKICSKRKNSRKKIILYKKIFLKENLKVRKVNDKDINHYLYCRNLKMNRKKSASGKIISTLDHYIWWFNTKRNSYVLFKNGKKILYFYDEKIFPLNKKKYFLSGWFACGDECTIKQILFALNWQKNLKKNVTWLSFVKMNNFFSIKLSKYLGWKILEKENRIIVLLKKKLKLKTKKFVFFERKT